MTRLKAKFFTNVVTGGVDCLSECCAGDVAPSLPHLEGVYQDVGQGAVGPEVFHPGEDAAHITGVSVARASMADGITVYCVLLMVEGELNGGGLAE